MKFAIMSILIITAALAADYFPVRFEDGYTFSACRTSLYEAPDQSSVVLIVIPAGELLEIPGFTGETFTADSCEWGWYEALYRLGNAEFTGYVQDRDLAFSHVSLGTGGVDTLFVYRITGFDPELMIFSGEASVVADGEILDRLDYRPCWTPWGRIFDYDISSGLADPSGFSDVRDLIRLSFNLYACGYENRDDLLAWTDDGRLIPGPKASWISEAGLFHYRTDVILPSDSGGVPEQVIHHSLGEEYFEETDTWVTYEEEVTVYLWTGDRFTELEDE